MIFCDSGSYPAWTARPLRYRLCLAFMPTRRRPRSNTAAADATAARVTLSLPAAVAQQLDALVARRVHANRSQAVSKLLAGALVTAAPDLDDRVLAGTVTLTYSHARRGVEAALTRIQHRYLKEVISTQRVHLAHGHTLEVLLLQAPGRALRRIADELLACKGVTNGQLYVCSEVLPPLHE
jgi:CopG family nickel-responsive transcriptional regulator